MAPPVEPSPTITQRRRYTVYWEAFVKSGSLRINPGPKDDECVLCAGWTPMMATSEAEAVRLYEEIFPRDRVVGVA